MNDDQKGTSRQSAPIPEQLRALVTGGATGMGFASAKRLLARGCAVMLCGRKEETLRSACETLRTTTGGECEYMVIDLAQPKSPAAAVLACTSTFGGIEILVNNAGVEDYRPFGELTADSWDYSHAVMARAPFLATQAACEQMSSAGWGRVINNASIAALRAEPMATQYSAAKASLLTLTRSTALEMAPYGVRANAINAGWVLTPMTEERLLELDEEGRSRLNPLGRAAEADEIAAVVEFLALDAPDFLTGEMITVDGGHTIYLPLP